LDKIMMTQPEASLEDLIKQVLKQIWKLLLNCESASLDRPYISFLFFLRALCFCMVGAS
jgi:hypothetical protein